MGNHEKRGLMYHGAEPVSSRPHYLVLSISSKSYFLMNPGQNLQGTTKVVPFQYQSLTQLQPRSQSPLLLYLNCSRPFTFIGGLPSRRSNAV